VGTNKVGIAIIILKTQPMRFLKSVRNGYTVIKMIKCNRMGTFIESISVINQLDAQNFCFTISLFHALQALHYTAIGIITPIGVMIPEAV